jgi:twinkle protein
MSFRTQGILNVVSIPFGIGAGDWIENSFDFLMQYQEVYLSFDNEEVSVKARDKAAARIGYERCKKLEMPAEFKDANEAHVAGYNLQLTVDAAIEFKPDKLIESNEIFEETILRLSKGRRELQGIPFLGLTGEHSIEFRVRPKEMTIYTGYPGSGKSNILYQMVAYLVFVLGVTVVIASLEEDAEDILGLIMIHAIGIQYDVNKPNVRNAFAAMRQVMKGKIFFYYHRNRAPFRDVLMHAEFAIRKHGASHFIMDSIAKTDLNIEDNEKANEFMGLITTSMNETGAHYHVVAHSKKGSDKNKWEMPGLQEIKGAAAFGIEIFNCLSIWKDPRKSELIQEFRKKGYVDKVEWINSADAPSGYGGFGNSKGGAVRKTTQMDWDYVKEYPDSILWVCKQKVGGVTGKYNFYYNKENNRMSPFPEDEGAVNPYAYEIYMEHIEGADEEEEIQL